MACLRAPKGAVNAFYFHTIDKDTSEHRHRAAAAARRVSNRSSPNTHMLPSQESQDPVSEKESVGEKPQKAVRETWSDTYLLVIEGAGCESYCFRAMMRCEQLQLSKWPLVQNRDPLQARAHHFAEAEAAAAVLEK
jgi:hypothetical protein